MKMKAAIYYGPHDIRIKEIDRPEVNPEGVILKVKACGVCNIMDLDAWERWPIGGSEVGLARGHEWSGELVEVGSEVTDFKVGDRIFQNPVFLPCFRCESCRVKDYWHCINWGEGFAQKKIHGAFAEYLWIPFITNQSAVKCPDTLSYQDLSLMEPLYLAVGISKKAKAGEVAVVLGQDFMGLAVTALMKDRGVKVITSDISQKRLKASEDMGADIVINDLKEDVVKVVMNETLGRGADVAIVTDPRPVALWEALGSVQRTGRIWTTHGQGLFDSDESQRKTRYSTGPDAAYRDETIKFDRSLLSFKSAWGTLGPRVPRWIEAIKIMESGRITAKNSITHTFPLDEISDAFNMAMNPHESIHVIVEL